MTKKDFTADAASVFVEKMIAPAPAPKAAQQPKKATKKPTPKQQPQPKEEIKETFFLEKQLDDRLRYYVFTQRTTLKAVITAALRDYLAKHAPNNK